MLNGTTTINDTLVVNATNVQFPDTLAANTTNYGLGQIANISELNSTASAFTDSGLNSAGPNFVTVSGLNYWKTKNKVLTQRTGSATLYVVPDNAVNGTEYNFNGTTATLTADPDRSGDDLSDDPPTSRAKAVHFSRAVDYANTAYSSAETVNYYLANGPYWTNVTFSHIANVYGALAEFPAEQELADFTAASTTPTTGVKALYDARFDAPCFATLLTVSTNTTIERLTIRSRPTRLEFEYGGIARGLIWLGADKTLNDTTNYPNSLFTTFNDIATYRTSSISVQDFIDDYVTAEFAASYQFDKFFGYDTMVLKSGNLQVFDCIFGPKASGIGSIGYGTVDGIVRVEEGYCEVEMNGIYLMGNITVTSLADAAAKGITINEDNTYGSRNCQSLVTNRTSSARPVEVRIRFDYRERYNPVGEDYDMDYDRNCIHVLDDNGNYGLMANRAATDGTRGATMTHLIGPMAPGSKLVSGGYASYRSSYAKANGHHGFAGVFGDVGNGGTQGPVGIGLDRNPVTLVRLDSYSASMWQQARTGTLVTSDETLTYASGQNQTAYGDSENNVLNIRSDVWYAGIDTATAQTVGGDLDASVGGGSGFYG